MALLTGNYDFANKIIANSGRVLNVVASGSTIEDARRKAYDLIAKINWGDGFVRNVNDEGEVQIKRPRGAILASS